MARLEFKLEKHWLWGRGFEAASWYAKKGHIVLLVATGLYQNGRTLGKNRPVGHDPSTTVKNAEAKYCQSIAKFASVWVSGLHCTSSSSPTPAVDMILAFLSNLGKNNSIAYLYAD
jgi:hypothetical protein